MTAEMPVVARKITTALLDGAEAGGRQMLMRPGLGAEPESW